MRPNNEVAERVRAAQFAAGITIYELAKRTGISRSTLTYQLHGGKLTVDTLVRCAAALEVTPAELIPAA